MTAEEYAKIRTWIGTQEAVAKLLQVNERTIKRRESGSTPVNNEASLAIRLLWVMNNHGNLV
jgi:DNA-binding XRE family transcriptional regulator